MKVFHCQFQTLSMSTTTNASSDNLEKYFSFGQKNLIKSNDCLVM